MTASFGFAAPIAGFGMLFRRSEFKAGASWLEACVRLNYTEPERLVVVP
jgi:hypothetical protein